jgi:hypothetical protein
VFVMRPTRRHATARRANIMFFKILRRRDASGPDGAMWRYVCSARRLHRLGLFPSASASRRVGVDPEWDRAYDSEVFHQLLGIEERRSARSGRPVAVVTVSPWVQCRAGTSLQPPMGRGLFAVLEVSVRESDIIGWYEAGRVAGIALTDLPETADVTSVTRRIQNALSTYLPNAANQLGVDVSIRNR